MDINFNTYTDRAIALLKRLIATPSVSRDETLAADIMQECIAEMGYEPHREANNVWALSSDFDEGKPTLLLNAHIDTVKPAASWTRNPFHPGIAYDRLYGLGSNDCGGGLVSLLQIFDILDPRERKYNMVYLASAEEEVSGKNGCELALKLLPKIDVAIVGEPTGMQPAIAEKGLMVVDCTAHGRSGHAARNEGVNALYIAMDDIAWIRNHQFRRTSDLLGPTKMTVTIVNAGTQHNVVPDKCDFTIDIRTNEYYRNEFVLAHLQKHLKSECRARSFRLGSSKIDPGHPIVAKCKKMGMKPFGSPTLSDQALMPFPSLKLGPGESSRSHSADEYICISEIRNAIESYFTLLDGLEL
ncbi:MAG: M20 family metallo-hydrolase [Prevotellaceae bacterium]|nr:M20 family metallo-hydrolase [Prevotellaceae bacterium]